MHEDVVTPDIVRAAKAEAAALVRDELIASPDLSLDIGQDLSALVVEAQGPWCAGEPFALEVAQQIEDGRRPCVTRAMNRLTDPNTDPRTRVWEEALGDEVDLSLTHVALLELERTSSLQFAVTTEGGAQMNTTISRVPFRSFA
jgi:hypothetical protein